MPVSAETLQKNLEQMGRALKSLDKDLETFPPPQSDRDMFIEKMNISFTTANHVHSKSNFSPVIFTSSDPIE